MELKIGIENELEIIVTTKDTAKAYGSGMVEVFATPAMVALMEKTALQLVAPFLLKGRTTVGTEICVKHLKPTSLGHRVQSYVKLNQIEGNKLLFQVEVYDEKGLIGTGTHKRYIVEEKEFMKSI